jgi:hypothetical protein
MNIISFCIAVFFVLQPFIVNSAEVERVMVEPNPLFFNTLAPQGVYISVSITRTNAFDIASCEVMIDPGDATGFKRLVIDPIKSSERMPYQYRAQGTYRVVVRGHSGCSGQREVALNIDQGTPATGATFGGMNFQRKCSDGEVLVGLTGRIGDIVDQIQIVCASIHIKAKGKPGAAPAIRGEPVGGTGGWPAQMNCPESQAIFGFKIGLNTSPDDAQWAHVRTIGLTCGAPDPAARSGAMENRTFGPATPSPVYLADLQCPPHAPVALGIHGRATSYLKAFGLICGSPPK